MYNVLYTYTDVTGVRYISELVDDLQMLHMNRNPSIDIEACYIMESHFFVKKSDECNLDNYKGQNLYFSVDEFNSKYH